MVKQKIFSVCRKCDCRHNCALYQGVSGKS